MNFNFLTSGNVNAFIITSHSFSIFIIILFLLCLSLFLFSFFTDGKCMACTYRVKFIEVSVGINHNVDELLAGTLTQIRLKKEHCELQVWDESNDIIHVKSF